MQESVSKPMPPAHLDNASTTIRREAEPSPPSAPAPTPLRPSSRLAGGATHALHRCIDVSGAISILVLTAPVLILAAAAIRLGDRGPIFSSRRSIGSHGRPFGLLGFRTSRVAGLGTKATLSSVGWWVRYFRLDDLPSLANVIRGDMALVGPCPEVVVEDHFHDGRGAPVRPHEAPVPGLSGWLMRP